MTTDDLLREAAETRFVQRRELITLLIEALEQDQAVCEQLARLLETVAKPDKPAEHRPEIMPGYAWLPTFKWQRGGENAFLEVTDIARVPFRLRSVRRG